MAANHLFYILNNLAGRRSLPETPPIYRTNCNRVSTVNRTFALDDHCKDAPFRVASRDESRVGSKSINLRVRPTREVGPESCPQSLHNSLYDLWSLKREPASHENGWKNSSHCVESTSSFPAGIPSPFSVLSNRTLQRRPRRAES